LRIQPAGEFDLNKRKQKKINESKIAFICFLLLTFIFSKRDFSIGYGRFKQKFFSRPREPALVAKRARNAPGHNVLGTGRGALGDRVSHRGDRSVGFFFAQENVAYS
jgi:hypothetical protein